MSLEPLREMVEIACRHLLSEQNRDPYTPTYGCFDRRYWGWKLVDYPEATFQRNVYPLACLLSQMTKHPLGTTDEPRANVLTNAVMAGLHFATRIQHSDGSFDQAFPHEHSFGATAFLLHPLLEAYRIVRERCTSSLREEVEKMLRRSAGFLSRYDERHGHIANHLAGGVLSLLVSADFFSEAKYERRASELLGRILAHQSSEGWFLEYEGADPGYQTLCLYYLAQVYALRPNDQLRLALERALSFLAWFVHPDGSFGGEYGSRRTSVFYPGGLALLSREFPLANSITRFMLNSIAEGHTVTVRDVDMGNLAPLLSNYMTLLAANWSDQAPSTPLLPWEEAEGKTEQDFAKAGLYVRRTPHYYAIVGASNGGVLKVFDRQKRSLIWNDGGYVGQSKQGHYITTQMTDLSRPCNVTADEITIQTPFYRMLRSVPTPFQFMLLRLLNLTVMRNIRLGNWIKGLLVRLLISGKRSEPLHLKRHIKFESERVVLSDKLSMTGQITLNWLEFGRPFVAIHMASARYFEGFLGSHPSPCQVEVKALNGDKQLQIQTIVPQKG